MTDMERAIIMIETTANMLRGMLMDPAIPRHAKEAMQARIIELEDLAVDLERGIS